MIIEDKFFYDSLTIDTKYYNQIGESSKDLLINFSLFLYGK